MRNLRILLLIVVITTVSTAVPSNLEAFPGQNWFMKTLTSKSLGRFTGNNIAGRILKSTNDCRDDQPIWFWLPFHLSDLFWPCPAGGDYSW